MRVFASKTSGKTGVTTWLRPGTTITLCLYGAATLAQTEGAPVLEQVTVTAQRRAENMQDVPVTLSAISGDAAISRGINSVSDLNVVAPGLNITNVVGNPLIYMRGVGNNNSTAGQEQNIAIYVDGVYYPSMSADPGTFKNIERIEVLKGPQGTLFGRNTTGGLIQIVTKDPTDELSGSVSAGQGNFETFDTSGYIAGGLTDTLAADFSASYSDQGEGWGHNLATGAEVNKSRSRDIRSKWVFKPGEDTKLTFSGAYTQIDTDKGAAQQVLTRTPLPPSRNGESYPGNIYDIRDNVTPFYTVEQRSASLKWDQAIGGLDFQATSAYQKTDRDSTLDLDNTSVAATKAYFPSLTESFSQELQLSSIGSSVSWVGGLLYYYADGQEDPLQILAGPTELAAATYNTGQKTRSIAGYGQATLALNDRNNVTIGGRYTNDRQELYGNVVVFTGTGFATLRPDPSTNTETFENFTYKLAFDHHFTDDVMGFVSVSTGYKSGVYNITFASPTARPVDPEKLIDYEVGLKTELFDHRARLNLNAFYYDYKDLQLQSYTGTAIVTLNAAKAEIYGLEVELQTFLTDRLQFQLGAAQMHSEYTDFPNLPSYDSSGGLGVPIAGLSGNGNQLMRTPDTTANASLDYQVPVSFGTLGANLTLYYTSSYFFEPDNRLDQQGFTLVNTELTWKSGDERYSVRLWGKNLGDEQWYYNKTSGDGTPDTGVPAPPRTFGISAGVKF